MNWLLLYLFAASLQEANQLYDRGEYDRAMAIYTSERLTNSDQLFNLANIYYRNQNFGHAVFYYLRALSLDPRNPDIKYNLDYTLKKAGVSPPTRSYNYYLSLSFLLSAKQRLLIFTSIFFVFWVLVIILIYFRNNYLKFATVVCLVLSILCAIPNLVALGENSNFAIVTAEKASVYSATGKDNVLLFILPMVSYVSVIGTSGDWMQISYEGKRGWIAKSEIVSDLN